MARGIISTILGGVAGGLEGLGVQQQRRREEERERDRDEREAAQRAFLNQLSLTQAGFEPGTPMRADVAGQAAESLRQTPVGRALDQAPLFAAPAEPGQQRALRDFAANVFGEPDFSDARRGRFVPDVQDERYFQIQTPDGQLYSRMTEEERRRQILEEEDRIRGIDDEEVQKMRLAAHRSLVRNYNYSTEYDPEYPYELDLEQQQNLERVRAGRTPQRPGDVPLTVPEQGVELLREFFARSFAEGANATELYGPGISMARAYGVDESVVRGMLGIDAPVRDPNDTEETDQPRLAPAIAARQQRAQMEQERAEAAEAELARLEDNLRQYDAALVLDPRDRELRGARARTIISLNKRRPSQYPIDAKIIREAELGPF